MLPLQLPNTYILITPTQSQHQYSKQPDLSVTRSIFKQCWGGINVLFQQWRSEDIRGPRTMDYPGPLPIFHNLISLAPSPTYTPTQTLHTFIAIVWFWIRHFLFSTVHISWCILEIWVLLMIRRWKWEPLDDTMINGTLWLRDAKLEVTMGAPWWWWWIGTPW